MQQRLVELLIDRVVVSNEEVEIRYVVPTNQASEQVHFSHLRADYRTGPSFHSKEVAGDAVLPHVPYWRADVGRYRSAPQMRKGQVKRLTGQDAQGQAKFVASLFQVAA